MTVFVDIDGVVRDSATISAPSDRIFRDAWQFNGDAIEVDMPAARNIHRNNLRAERKPQLEALDVDYMKALEDGDTPAQQAIVGVKQVLRDVTADPRIEAATTPDELKALTLDVLTA